MNEAKLRFGLNQLKFGVALTLLGPYLLWSISGDFPRVVSVICALLPALTILGLSNCRKAAPAVAPGAAKVAWLSVVTATMLQVGVSISVFALNIGDYRALGQLYMIAALLHLVCLLFLLVYAADLGNLVEAPDLSKRFRHLSGAVPIAALTVFYLFVLAPQLVFPTLLLTTFAFLVLLSKALSSLATRVSTPVSLE